MASLEELVISLRADSSRVENALNSIENRLTRLGSASERTGITLQNALNRTNFSQLTTRLQQVERAQENVRNAFESGRINTGQYERAIQPLNQLRNSLNSLIPANNSLSNAFSRSFRSASSLQTGFSGLDSVLGTLLNPITLVTGAFIALAGAFTLGVKGALDAGVELERQKTQLGGLINATTQFRDSQGKALNPVDNLNASVEQAGVLYTELRKQALLLADIDTGDLLQASTASLPALNQSGVNDPKEQAQLIGTVTAAIKQLGIAKTQAEASFETRSFFTGDITNANAEFAKLIATTNGGTEAFKKNFEEAKKNGTVFEFLNKSLLSFRQSGELASQTLSNQFSVLNDSISLVNSTVGSGLLPAFKSLTGNLVGQFFEKGIDGSLQFKESILQTAESIGVNLGQAFTAIEPLIKPVFDIILNSIELVSNVIGALGEAIGLETENAGNSLQTTADVIGFVGDRIGGLVKIVVGTLQASVLAVRVQVGVILGIIQGAINLIIAGINKVANFISQKSQQIVPQLNFTAKIGVDKKSLLKSKDQIVQNFGGGFQELLGGGRKQRNLFANTALNATKKKVNLKDLTAGSKGGPDPGKTKKAKKAKGDGLADDRNRLALLNEEGLSLEKQASILDKIFAKKKSILAESIKNNALTLKQAQDEAKQDVGKERRNLEQETALNALEVERAKIEQAKALGLINERTASQKLSALDQEKIRLESNFALENARIESQNKIAGIEREKAGIQEKLTQLIQDSNLKETEKLATLDATREKLNGQIAALQGQKDKFDDIKKLQNELLKNDLERKKILGELSLDQATKLAELETELGKKDILIQKEKELLGIKQQSISLQASNKSQLESISVQTEVNKTKFQGLNDLAKGFGDNLKGAFEEGKFNAEKFFNGMIELLGNFATKAIETLFSAGGQGGGVGILSGLFSGFGIGGSGGGRGFSNGAPSDGGFGTASQVFNPSTGQWQATGRSDSAITSWSSALSESTANLNNFSSSCNKTDGSLGGLGQGLSGIAGSFGSILQGAGQQIGGFAGTAVSALGSILSGILNAVMSAFGGGGGLGLGFATGGLVKAATGGYISGSGTSTSDSIPAMLSNGEYVINAKSTEKFMPLLNAINSGKFKGFSSGGVVMNSRGASANGLPSGGIMNGMTVSKQPIINITAMDSQDVIRALTKKDVRKHLFDTSNNAVQTSSNKAFNRSTMEFSK